MADASFYKSAEWAQLRRSKPPKDCACGATWHPGFHLDHVIPRAAGGRDDLASTEWMCRPCHSSKTVANDGGFGRPKKPGAAWKPRRRVVGSDGWPVE